MQILENQVDRQLQSNWDEIICEKCPNKVVWHGAHQRGFLPANGEEDDRIVSFDFFFFFKEKLLKSEWDFAREG